MNSLFDQIVRRLKAAKIFFAYPDQLVCVRKGSGPLHLTAQNLSGHLSSYLEIYYRSVRSGRFGPLTRDLSLAFLSSPRVISQFPTLSLYTRVPTFDSDWRLVARPGYHAGSMIFYEGPPVRPRRTTALLDRLLKDFCWKSDADRVNFIGLLLTSVTMRHWVGKHALAIFNSNMPRLGKSLLARALGLLTDGSCRTVTYTPNDEEFERQLATRVEEGNRVVIIDNAKHSQRASEVSSGVLERSVTDPTLCYRRLRTNTSISRPNDVIFCLTMNTAKLSPDLRHRGLPVNLHWEGDVRHRRFRIPEAEAFITTHRLELIAELLGMVQRWIDAGRPIPEDAASHSVSQQWAATIDGILRVNGYHGFLSNFDASEQSFDRDHATLVEVCTLAHDARPQTAAEWAATLEGHGLLNDRLSDGPGQPKSTRAKATIVGTLFNRYVNARFEVEGQTYRLKRKPASTTSHVSPRHWFEVIDEDAQRRVR